ncbi:4273_t:CDS:2 [Scutellospora calospora]|uniref:4273_t:CDS:1 n=1 Tax=Scutellospora calospora TaxID=85575 RepID=A0ACA9KCG3_9GLOM|nr:4273_t:CDS:2 [Scutellospora calospora]
MSKQSAQLEWYGTIFQQSLSEKKPLHFMLNNVEDTFELINQSLE